MDTAVVWFRDDLRVTDNPTLADAVTTADEIVPVYVVDPHERGETRDGTEKLGTHRARFRRESLLELRAALRERGGELFVRQGRPETVVPDIAGRVDADAVYAQTKPATEERKVEDSVRAALPDEIAFEHRWTHTLYHVSDLPTSYERMGDTFTPWRKEIERECSIREPVEPPKSISTPALPAGGVPTLSDLGLETPPEDERTVLAFEGGESAGKRRLEAYFWEGDHLREYKETRNGMLGADYSSKFSPWLAAGCLSPRWIYDEVRRYEAERVSNEDTYWLVFELLWRDFFQFQFCKYGAQFFHPNGIRDIEKAWEHDRETFERWANGETGIPFVDANMRELNRTGYMSNRGRQNVASFLADALGIDWRWGAAYFEERLVDYDVASNWGNWAYQAGVGNDSRDNYFDVLSQAEYYDADGEYVTTWRPELEGLPSAFVHRPWRLSDEQQATYGVELGVDYPRPMIDIEARYEELDS
ncbi:deoxyribodipyrimidine photo-lyase (single-stranded DNA-specific) [Natrinema hispanicum]|uniref:Cryptochrome DASH n=1 Tax=Natrinema hispanicum TaxID=392421 RepID=A0A482Y6U7_9EURY|nr:DASH family cryptochrome [Natrinema hispanicum]RZV06324.1 deoxyribodipyrimidine photo-lyase (single-stranded DNA-specific) [Natrinema hispanicum]